MVTSPVGFLDRKGDGEPGTQSLWHDLHRVDDIDFAWALRAAAHPRTHATPAADEKPTVSGNPEYG